MFVNKVIKILILSDLALLTGLGFIAPILAIFLTDNIKGGDVAVAGAAGSAYWIANALVVIPFGRFLDKRKGERDDLLFIMIGNFFALVSVLGFLFATLPWHIYVLEAIYGIGMGMNIPAYTGIFTRHIDQGKESFSWSLRTALIGVGTGVAGVCGGLIAKNWGFDTLFMVISFFIILSTILPILIIKEMSRQTQDKDIEKVAESKTMSAFPPVE